MGGQHQGRRASRWSALTDGRSVVRAAGRHIAAGSDLRGVRRRRGRWCARCGGRAGQWRAHQPDGPRPPSRAELNKMHEHLLELPGFSCCGRSRRSDGAASSSDRGSLSCAGSVSRWIAVAVSSSHLWCGWSAHVHSTDPDNREAGTGISTRSYPSIGRAHESQQDEDPAEVDGITRPASRATESS